MRLKNLIAAAVGLSPFFAVAANAASTEWNHNGSIMELESNGNARIFTYKSPRPGMPMKPGDVLFKGVRKGNSYVGTAFTFSSRCPSLSFEVQGELDSNQRYILMRGQAPRRGANCDDITYFQETLEFTSVEPPAASTVPTEWNHNGSVMTLQINGSARTFVYTIPRANIPVKAGDVLFKGARKGNAYTGTVYTYSSRCPTLSFEVQGDIMANQRTVLLWGQAPRRGASCDDITYSQENLEFTLIDPVAQSPAPIVGAPSVPSLAVRPATADSPSTEPLKSVPGKEIAPSSVPSIQSKPANFVGLPYIKSDGVLPAGTSDASGAYNICAELWNEQRYGDLLGARGMVVGIGAKSSSDTKWSCRVRWDKGLEFNTKNNGDMVSILLNKCRETHNTCFIFAVGDEMSNWAREQRRAYDRLPSARP